MRTAAVAAVLSSTIAIVLSGAGSSGSGSVSLTVAGVTEDLNSLSATTSPSNVLPAGWYVSEEGTGAAADGQYVVGTGSSSAGGVYSFGSTGSSDRALGSVGSGTVTPIHFGVRFTNNTGAVITSLAVSYTGEMWRRSTAPAAAGEKLTFSYSTDATSLTAGTFTTVPALSFASPGDACSSTQNVATDGNSAPCRRVIAQTITGLIVPNGQTIWIRWTDMDTVGSEDALAVDDLAIGVTTNTISINPTATGLATPAPVNPGQTVTLSGTIVPGQNPTSASVAVSCDTTAIGGSGSQSLAVSATSFSGEVAVSSTTVPNVYSVPCSVIDDQRRSNTFGIRVTVLLPLTSTCFSPATPIHVVQGAGAVSPLAGQTVDIEGLVVGAFQGASLLNGFYLQEPPATDDGNPATSEGIFVFAADPSVMVGDRVRIRGTVSEFPSATGARISNLTELGGTSNATVCSQGNALPVPVDITLPVSSVTEFERYEGMLVQFRQPLFVTGSFNLGTFGQIDVASSVLFQPTQTPGTRAIWSAHADLNDRSRIALDDDSTLSNANLNNGGVAPYPAPGLSASNTLRVGSLVNPGGASTRPLIGIIDDRFGSYRIQPTGQVAFSIARNPRPDSASIVEALGGRFRVASANVLNFFTTLGGRGAQTAQELLNQRTKIIAELSKLNADVLGLSEVQNLASGSTGPGTHTNAAIADLTTSLAAATGRPYQFIDTISPTNIVGGDITQNGTDAIRNAIIYDSARVTPVGGAALYYQNDTNRPSLAQTFRPASGIKAASQTFTVVVNHFRSKGSACGGASDDPCRATATGCGCSWRPTSRSG